MLFDVRLVLADHARDRAGLLRRAAEERRLADTCDRGSAGSPSDSKHDVVAVLQHRHAAARIHLQHLRRLVLLLRELHQVRGVRQLLVLEREQRPPRIRAAAAPPEFECHGARLECARAIACAIVTVRAAVSNTISACATPAATEARCPDTLDLRAELAPHVADPDWLIVDCRFDLGNPARRARLSRRAHSGRRLCASRPRPGRADHADDAAGIRCPQPERFAATLGALGHDASDAGDRLRRRQRHVRGTAVVDAALGRARRGRRARWRLQGVDCGRTADVDRRSPRASRRVTSWRGRIATCGSMRAKLPTASQRSDWRLLDARAPERFGARSSRSIRSPVTCRARAIIRSRPISAATVASQPAQELRRASTHRRAASPTIARSSCAAPASPPVTLLLAMEVAGKRGARLVSRLVERMDPRSGATRRDGRSGSR